MEVTVNNMLALSAGLLLFMVGIFIVVDYKDMQRVIGCAMVGYGLQVVIAARIKIERGKP